MPPVLAQLLRFSVVGASNTLVTLAAYAAGLRLGLPYVAAGALGFAAGGVNGFALNRRWTFHHRGPARAAAARYATVQLIGLAANAALLALAVHRVGVPRPAGEAAAVLPVTLLTFALTRAWALAPALPHDASPPPHARAPRRPRRRAGAVGVGAGAPAGRG